MLEKCKIIAVMQNFLPVIVRISLESVTIQVLRNDCNK
jgi:hypothetical protein